MTGSPPRPRPVVAVAASEFAVHDRRPLDALEASGAEVRINGTGHRLGRDELIAFAGDADGVIAGLERYDAGVLDDLPRLRFISRVGVGVDNVDLAAARRRGVAVLNTPHAPTEAVAELAVTMILTLLRGLVTQHLAMRRREWTRTSARLLKDRSVVVIGLGRIGRRVIELVQPFEARLHGVDPGADAGWCKAHRVELTDLAGGLPLAEVLCVVAAKDPRTPLCIGARELASMPQGAVVVNVARGGLVDESALADALRAGALAGAGLDVYEQEPYRGPLCDIENVVLTPHAATAAIETRVAMEIECVDNVVRALGSQPVSFGE